MNAASILVGEVIPAKPPVAVVAPLASANALVPISVINSIWPTSYSGSRDNPQCSTRYRRHRSGRPLSW